MREIQGTTATGLEDKLKQLETTIGNMNETLQGIKTENKVLTDKIAKLDNIIADNVAHTNVGNVYTRWGRTSCLGNGDAVVYSGYAAGGYYTHGGRSPELLCLPEDPEWGTFDESLNNHGGFLYGAEYELKEPGRGDKIFGENIDDQDVLCAVCEVKQRTRQLMISGRTTCYDGWTREYWGYLMTGHYSHSAQAKYYCIDANPEVLPEGTADQNGFLLYLVEVRGDSLEKTPYIQGRELPCVVCTK